MLALIIWKSFNLATEHLSIYKVKYCSCLRFNTKSNNDIWKESGMENSILTTKLSSKILIQFLTKFSQNPEP